MSLNQGELDDARQQGKAYESLSMDSRKFLGQKAGQQMPGLGRGRVHSWELRKLRVRDVSTWRFHGFVQTHQIILLKGEQFVVCKLHPHKGD